MAFSSTPFAPPTPKSMPKLAGTASDASQAWNQGDLKEDIETRSKLFAGIMTRLFPLGESINNTFQNPISLDIPDDALTGLVNLFAQVINPSFLDQITGANKRFELHAKFLRGLAFCFDYVATQAEESQQPKLEPLLLYSMMPIYLASSREKIVPAVESTLGKLRRSVCVANTLRVLGIDAGYIWLGEQTRSGVDLDAAIEQDLRLSMPRIMSQYWRTHSLERLTSESDKGLWNITCQLMRGESQIHVPKSLSLGVVSWQKIIEHWNALKLARANTATFRADYHKPIVGPVEAVSPQTSELANPAGNSPQQENSETKSTSQSIPPLISSEPLSRDQRLVEIRSSSDPQLKIVLEQLLQRSREEQSLLSIAVVSRLSATAEFAENWFSPMIDQIIEASEAEDLKGFVTDAGELALMFYDIDRSDISYWLRESFSRLRNGSFNNSMHSEASEQLIAGVAMVNAPSRSFQLDQLIDAAWRCRDGAAIQGANAVKTIEVY